MRTREKNASVQSSVTRVLPIKQASETLGGLVTVIMNIDIPKAWTVITPTNNCVVLLFDLERKSFHIEVVPILEREKEICRIVIRSAFIRDASDPLLQLSRHRRETAEYSPSRVQNHSQCVCMTITSPVKYRRMKILATASPQK
jgi:hypothetical protein